MKKEKSDDVTEVLDYWLEQCLDDDRPGFVLLAMCRAKWPDHKGWHIKEEDEEEGLYYLRACVDEDGVSAADLL